ncbi:hypothetical protein B0H66DRAFT_19056 [Apodospora peruviana]|uniref:Secreted protein n=1 Tax=Apodospora peruviana TaxID=516989 RepID=A0AAE0IQ97_9PEZI|nr:hypothetical protein B0H66DRAFT_19056 [Apodospora peruviana]
MHGLSAVSWVCFFPFTCEAARTHPPLQQHLKICRTAATELRGGQPPTHPPFGRHAGTHTHTVFAVPRSPHLRGGSAQSARICLSSQPQLGVAPRNEQKRHGRHLGLGQNLALRRSRFIINVIYLRTVDAGRKVQRLRTSS